METTTIIGIVIAVGIIIFALYILLRKPKEFVPSLDAELHINPETNQPVLPRFVRQQLNMIEFGQKTKKSIDKQAVPETKENKENSAEKESEVAIESQEAKTIDDVSKASEEKIQTEKVEKISLAEPEAATVASEKKEQVAMTQAQAVQVVEDKPKKEPVYHLNKDIEKAEIKEFDEESSILDMHLNEQQRYDDECSLANAQHIISLNVYPGPRCILSGDKTLKILLKYGLRFGELSCFHRYKNIDDTKDDQSQAPLMFSVLKISDEGPVGFDLETLSTEQVHGLAFFLALPNTYAQEGFDTMASTAGLIAREIDGKVFDENNDELSVQLKEYWRRQVIDFKPTASA